MLQCVSVNVQLAFAGVASEESLKKESRQIVYNWQLLSLNPRKLLDINKLRFQGLQRGKEGHVHHRKFSTILPQVSATFDN